MTAISGPVLGTAELSLQLPEGLSQRPLDTADAAAVTAVMAAQELQDVGEVFTEEADIIADWQKPSYDVRGNTVGVFESERLVAYAEFVGGDQGYAAVHPAYCGQGIGTELARWMQEKARLAGSSLVGMSTPLGSPGDVLLEQLGYGVRWTSWELTLPEGRRIERQSMPDGYAIRTAVEAEYESVWAVLEDAFLEWSDRERHSFDDFAAGVWLRPGFAPWNLRVAVDPEGVTVGVAFVILSDEGATAYVQKLAVRKDHRGLGLARALLADAFELGRAHGASTSVLDTDSRTGALGLYEKVGMEVTSVWVNRCIELRPG